MTGSDPGFELDRNATFHRREWAAERVAMVAFVLILLVAGFGLFGDGPLSESERTSASGLLTVHYQRFVRQGGSDQLKVELAPGAGAQGQVKVWVSQSYLSHVQVQSISPQPDSSAARGDGVVYTFQAQPSAPLTVVFSVQPTGLLREHAAVALNAEPPVRFGQFVYP